MTDNTTTTAEAVVRLWAERNNAELPTRDEMLAYVAEARQEGDKSFHLSTVTRKAHYLIGVQLDMRHRT